MPTGRIVWGGILAAAGCFELYGIANPGANDTLSEFTRWAFMTDTTAGRWVFGIGWVAFAVWFVAHILSGRNSKTD